jgi:hypothetical protein
MPLIFCVFYFDSPGLSTFLSTPAASFRIVPIRQPELQFMPVAFRISDFVSLRIVAFGPRRLSFAFDLFACLSPAFNLSGWSSFPSTSAAYFRIVAFRFAFDLFGYVHSPSMSLAVSPHSISFSTASFRIVALSSSLVTIAPLAFATLGCGSWIPLHPASLVSFRCASLRFDVVDLPSHSVSSHSFGLAFDFSIHLRLRIVSLRLACLRLHSTSTFLHTAGRPVLRPRGGGVGHCRQSKTPKTPNQKNQQKKKPATITTPRKHSRLIHSCSVQS